MKLKHLIQKRQIKKRTKRINEILSTRCKYCRGTNKVRDQHYTKKHKVYRFYCLDCKQKWKIKLKRQT